MHKVSLTVIGFACASVMVAQPRYEVVDLTDRFGESFRPQNINNAGQIGASLALKAPSQACVIEPDGSLRFLPRYKGLTWTMTELADNGDALGRDTFGTGTEQTILFHGGTVANIGVQGTITNPAGRGVNTLGQVVGYDYAVGRPFIWENGKLAYLPNALPIGNQPAVINDTGMIAGIGATLQSGPYAVRWVDGIPQQINPPWALDSRVTGISDTGEIAGWGHNLQNRQRAILWRKDGSAIDLGDLGGGAAQANDVNQFSQVVGVSHGGEPSEGFFWDDGEMFALLDLVENNKAWHSMSAFSINDAGQLLAIGSLAAQPEARYLLLNPVPEPGTLVILICGSITLAICRRSRRQKINKVPRHAGRRERNE